MINTPKNFLIRLKSNHNEKERPISELGFKNTSHRLKEEFVDRYKGVKSEILSSTMFNENSQLSTTYLGKTKIVKESKITTEEKFPISEQGYTTGKL